LVFNACSKAQPIKICIYGVLGKAKYVSYSVLQGSAEPKHGIHNVSEGSAEGFTLSIEGIVFTLSGKVQPRKICFLQRVRRLGHQKRSIICVSEAQPSKVLYLLSFR